jgi:NAD(P)-dependent dehydrogenase (short-subunit alcohol dehydrogenase family)
VKRIFITGSNRGLGLALVKLFLERGDRVIAGCRRPAEASALQQLTRSHRDSLSVVPIDVDDEESIRSARRVTGDRADALELLINNAAILRGDSAMTMAAETMIASFRTNTVGPMLAIRHFLDLLRRGSQPAIVNISSEAGSLTRYQNSAHICSYACTKAALNMATRCIAHELASEKIPVVAVYPGWVRTDMGGKDGALSPEESATGVVTKVIDRLCMEMSGEFFTWEGEVCPW